MSTVSSLRAALKPWFTAHKRDLPWRRTTDPYLIWLSEVILQQTRVDQGMAYWRRFADRYPDVRSLAQATDDEVMRMWQGLGYYSRARNLKAAARQVVEMHDGRFPQNYEGLKRLKGVGDYTAAAIGSICFSLPEPVVDGNVYRVLARAFGMSIPIDSADGRREFRELAASLLDREEPGEHNQAMMELGATVCKPRDPDCSVCPFNGNCVALRQGRVHEFPVKAGRVKVRTRHFNYFFISDGDRFYLRKRTGKDIWQNLYELPLIETERSAGKPGLLSRLKKMLPANIGSIARAGDATHILSHQRLQAVFWEARLNGNDPPADWIPVTFKDLERYAIPRLIERWLQESGRLEATGT